MTDFEHHWATNQNDLLADKKKEVMDRDIEALISDEVLIVPETYKLESINKDLSFTEFTALTSACDSPAFRWYPSPIILLLCTITHPTKGFGYVFPTAFFANCIHRRI